jgi:hypothetical protein
MNVIKMKKESIESGLGDFAKDIDKWLMDF